MSNDIRTLNNDEILAVSGGAGDGSGTGGGNHSGTGGGNGGGDGLGWLRHAISAIGHFLGL